MTLLGVNLRVSGYSSQGGRKYMEDSLSIAAQETDDGKDLEYAFFGIYDGHGGKEASLYAKEHLMDTIVNLRYFWSDDDHLVLKAIRDGFLSTHLAMWKELENWPKTATGLPSTAGTTASVAFIKNGKLYIGHVGDSRIVIGQSDSVDGIWEARSLTTDHKPESVQERKRIYDSGGLVMKKSGIDRVVWKRPKVGHQGPVRRSTDFDKIPFLAVARSLGDLWSYDFLHETFVVSPEPDVSVVTIDPSKDRCLILASDGLWNTLSPQEAVFLLQGAELENENLARKLGIAHPKDPILNNPSKVLVNGALERWNKLKMRADNTSVITIILEPLGMPRSTLHEAQDFLNSMLNTEYNTLNRELPSNVEMNENINLQNNANFPDHNRLHTRPGEHQTSSFGSVTVPSSDPATQRLSSSPLQSLNIFNEDDSSSTHRNNANAAENNIYPMPRWSKSASGQTSLSKLASWRELVNKRHSTRDPIFEEELQELDSIGSSADLTAQAVSVRRKSKHSLPSVKSTAMHSSTIFIPDKDYESCNCDSQKVLSASSMKHLSFLRQTIKRKYPGVDVSCSVCYGAFECECSKPWKRRPAVNRLNITAFKAINEFRLSQYHRLKF